LVTAGLQAKQAKALTEQVNNVVRKALESQKTQ